MTAVAYIVVLLGLVPKTAGNNKVNNHSHYLVFSLDYTLFIENRKQLFACKNLMFG